jgi:glycosyltransferase involved in cell wall biosynthesis
MKKLLVIVPYSYLPWYSGGQKYIGRFLEYLGKETELTVVGTENNDWTLAKTYKGIPLLRTSFSRYYDRSLVKKISALVQSNHFDAVIWEHPYYWWLAKKIRRLTGIQTIIHTHNIEYQRFRSVGKWWWPILKFYEKRCFKKADALFFISEDDQHFALTSWNIPAGKCFVVPFGIDQKEFPADRSLCRKELLTRYKMKDDEAILLFTGLLNYKPNLDALMAILGEINPLLLQSPLRYKIIICGKGLPEQLHDLKEFEGQNIIYAGFIHDIETYFKSADLLLNPVISGGGVKTKIVEAIGYGATVISTQSGAKGMNKSVCGNKLIEVRDNAWNEMVQAVLQHANQNSPTPGIYYEQYYWVNIVKSLLAALSHQLTG